MNRHSARFKKLLGTLGKFLRARSYLILCLLPMLAVAEDIDVFFGAPLDDSGALPNVLFILDNSGSMNQTDGDSKSRLDELKEAFGTILDNVNGVNVGLAQFTYNNGASIISGVKPLTAASSTAPVQVVIPSFDSTTDPQIDRFNTAYTNSSSYLTGSITKMGFENGSLSPEVHKVAMADSTDNLLVERTGFNTTTEPLSNKPSKVKFGEGTFVAVRLHLDVPRGAKINSAKITFVPWGAGIGKSNNDPVTYEVSAINANSHQDLDLYTQVGEMQATNWQEGLLVTSQLEWALARKNVNQTLDITSLVQPVVKNAQWDSDRENNSVITLMFRQKSGTGIRWLGGTDGDSNFPTVDVTYQMLTGATQALTTAIRFPNVTVPGGAVIKSAKVVLTPQSLFLRAADTSSGQEDSVGFTVAAHSSANSGPFPLSGSSSTITQDRTRTVEKVNWIVAADDWNEGQAWTSPDISGIVQSIVSRPRWCSGNALSLIIIPNTSAGYGVFEFDSSSAPSAYYPRLNIEYTMSPDNPPTCNNASLLSVGSAQTEDSGYQDPDTAMNISVANIPLDNTKAPKIALRFPNISVNKGSSVNSATLLLKSSGDYSAPVTLKIRAEKKPLTTPLSPSDGDIGGRTLLNNPVVTWPITGSWSDDQSYESVNIGPIIQALIQDRAWDAGNNSILLVLEPTGGSDRFFEASAARLQLQVPLGSVSVDQSALVSKQVLKNLVMGIEGVTNTPLVDSLFEATRYFRGDPVAFGKRRASNVDVIPSIHRRLRVSHNDSWTRGRVMVLDSDGVPVPNISCQSSSLPGCETEYVKGAARYISPIKSDCSSNHLVVLTDGQPNSNYISGLVRGIDPLGISNTIPGLSSCNTAYPSGQVCGRELAELLNKNDQVRGKLESKVHVHTIAFNLNNPTAEKFLKDLATKGGGKPYTANSVAGLVGAISSIFDDAINANNVSTKPSVGVSIFNKLFHQESVYYSLFSPKRSAYWPGNIKGYFLKDVSGNGVFDIVDDNGDPAIDPSTGFFSASARSRWSARTDGDQILEGGVVSVLPLPDARHIYTDITGEAPMDLSAPSNSVSLSNGNLNRSLFGPTATNLDRKNAIDFMRGLDVLDANKDGNKTDIYKTIGDPLHTSPVTVTYDGQDPDNPDEVVFSAGNDGALRAFDAKTGRELWAFYVHHFLKNQVEYTRQGGTVDKLYGIDNTPVMWYYDKKQDGVIDPSEDHVYLYLTMRRGGPYIYALDVTKKTQPKLLWRRKGGDIDYRTLVQTWSQPVKTTIKYQGVKRDVLVMGAGYNPQLDDDSTTVTATPGRGNGVFIIDAVTGTMIAAVVGRDTDRSGPTPERDKIAYRDRLMVYSFPASPEVLDINLDGFADQIYIPDVGGQLWRFDINSDAMTIHELLRGGVIANLNSEPPAAGEGARRFFNRPDISVTFSGGQKILAVSLGSGEVTRPFNRNIQNRFYVVAQQAVFGPPAEYVPELEGVGIKDFSTASAIESGLGSGGWYINLKPTEKVYASSTTFNKTVMFTTYVPPVITPGTCTVPVGAAYFYALKLANGRAAVDLNKNGSINPEGDRRTKLKIDVVPPGPTLILLENAEHPLILVGPEQPLLDVDAQGLLQWQPQFSEILD